MKVVLAAVAVAILSLVLGAAVWLALKWPQARPIARAQTRPGAGLGHHFATTTSIDVRCSTRLPAAGV